MKRSLLSIGAVLILLTGCSSALAPAPGPIKSASRGIIAGSAPCGNRANRTVSDLEACIQEATLWRRLSEFQRIANENPGPDGHGNRDTGTSGYKASVDYVAGLMRQAGYSVTIQSYGYTASQVAGTPKFRSATREYALERDWFVARGSHAGTLNAPVQPPENSGCDRSDFARFIRGNVALIETGTCAPDALVSNARAAGAAAVVLYAPEDVAHQVRLIEPAGIPVIGVARYRAGADLLSRFADGKAPSVRIEIDLQPSSGTDYNLIAESPYGNAKHTVVVDAHLDSVYGAGMLDNASGSTTILEIALNMAKTPTRNRLRYIWFGGEELGLLGSQYYTQHLPASELHRMAFDVDADVTATPNFDIMVADPAYAYNVKRFPPNVVPGSRTGNDYFADFFTMGGVISRNAPFGNDGTDSNSFSLVGVPNTGILTQQDCCKQAWETKLWGGFLGNYEGRIPSYDGGCVDMPDRWCDNLSNNDPFVLELISKATAFVTYELADDASLHR